MKNKNDLALTIDILKDIWHSKVLILVLVATSLLIAALIHKSINATYIGELKFYSLTDIQNPITEIVKSDDINETFRVVFNNINKSIDEDIIENVNKKYDLKKQIDKNYLSRKLKNLYLSEMKIQYEDDNLQYVAPIIEYSMIHTNREVSKIINKKLNDLYSERYVRSSELVNTLKELTDNMGKIETSNNTLPHSIYLEINKLTMQVEILKNKKVIDQKGFENKIENFKNMEIPLLNYNIDNLSIKSSKQTLKFYLIAALIISLFLGMIIAILRAKLITKK